MPNSTLIWKGVFMDLYPVLKILRKIEFFILPLLPARWREPPPSYRIALPVLNFLNPYTKKIRVIDALVYSIKKEGYRPYHLDGLGQAGPFTKGENRWLALIFSVVLLGLISAFTHWGKEYSAMIKTVLFMGGSALALYGAMNLRVSALWTAWGFLCPILALLPGTVVPSWFMVLLGLFVIVWAVPLLDPDDGWKWYDCLGTLPILFFWMPLPFVPGWSTWLTGMAALLSWGLIWLAMMCAWRLKTGKGGRVAGFISRTLQLFWVSNLSAIVIFSVLMKPLLRHYGLLEVCPWSVWWLVVTLGTAMVAGAFHGPLVTCAFLFRGSVVLAVTAAYGASLLLTGGQRGQPGLDFHGPGLHLQFHLARHVDHRRRHRFFYETVCHDSVPMDRSVVFLLGISVGDGHRSRYFYLLAGSNILSGNWAWCPLRRFSAWCWLYPLSWR